MKFTFLKEVVRKAVYCMGQRLAPDIYMACGLVQETNKIENSSISPVSRVIMPNVLIDSVVGDYSYLAPNGIFKKTSIGKFCSIGPGVLSGWGVHPLDGISTSPMFYSTQKQNGLSLTEKSKIKEQIPITIGNDVFIGMRTTILDGVSIGNGAVIGAGAVVAKSIPPYAVAFGNPIVIHKYRFSPSVIAELEKMKWWDWPFEKLSEIEMNFFSMDRFLSIHKKH